MIERYEVKEIDELFTLERRYKTFLDVEIANLEAYSELGIIPKEDVDSIKSKAHVNVDRINELEKQYKHDVISFTRSIDEELGEEKRWFHYGLTSTDVVDTAMSIIYNDATSILKSDLSDLLLTLEALALRYKDTPCIARTHGMHAEISSFGLRFVRFFDEIKRNLKRLLLAKDELCLVKLEGAVGNFAFASKDVEEIVAKKFNLKTPLIATQVISRDNHTNYLNSLALIATSIENMCVEFRNLSRNEIFEVSEGFSSSQKGSSAMPHKRNPISFENMCGLARVIRSYAFGSYDNIPLYHERDISHSSSERIIFPDAIELTSYIVRRMTKTMQNLDVHEENIHKNIYLTKGVVFSQRILTRLVEKGLSREESYDLVQSLALRTLNGEFESFRNALESNEIIIENLKSVDLDELFDEKYYLRNIDFIYKRVGLI